MELGGDIVTAVANRRMGYSTWKDYANIGNHEVETFLACQLGILRERDAS